MTPLDIVADLARALGDAEYTLVVASVDLWQQAWPSTTLGHRGTGGQTVTTGSVVVVIGDARVTGARIALVYSGGRLLHRTTPVAAERAIAARQIPAAGGVWP